MMKMIKKKNKELKGPSLTIKWALASSFFIFVIFTVFAVTTYKSAVSLFVEKERKQSEETTYQIVSKLADNDQSLTLINVYRKLTDSSESQARLYDRTSTLKGNMMSIDPFIAELGQNNFRLYVYNPNYHLVFKTKEESLSLQSVETIENKLTTINQQVGLLSVQPVISKQTREKIGYVQTFYELSSMYEMKRSLLMILIAVELISLLLSLILAFLLSSYYLKPLKMLRDTMETIRKDPQSDIHAPVIETRDELSDLSEIFNEMIDRMRTYIEQQEQFVEDVSHELRTPVAIIEGHLSMLNRWGKDDPEILEESLSASMQEIKRMKDLVQEMLDLSRAKQVDIYYGNETCQAKEVVNQVFNNFKLLYPDFMFVMDDDLPRERTLQIYRNHFEQILIIILDNAVKYSLDRKEIHVSISSNMKELEIAIQDFGEGIPVEDLQKVFNRFYRVDKARARTKGGNGLGLSIAYQLLESYKGRITVESSLGQGTIFRIYVPIIKSEQNSY